MSRFIVGLTGGIGSGKTTVANIFATLNIVIVDADIVAREVVAPQTIALAEITRHFGADILQADGFLNRAKLREIIFTDNSQKAWLNNLLHPIIRQECTRQLQLAESAYAILSAPLLLENNMHPLVNRVLVVDVSEEIQIKRTMRRDQNSLQQTRSIMSSQFSRQQRLALADDVLDNNDTDLTVLTNQIKKLHQQYLLFNQN
jgi:dephospho-CoA kinase